MTSGDVTSEAARKKRRHRNERIAASILVGCLLLGVTLFLRWNSREADAFQRQRMYIPPRTEITPEITLLREYLRIDTTAGNETAGARWLASVLEKNGIAAEVIESSPGRGNVYARIKGRQPGGGLLLLHHIDVVDPGTDKWSHPPFSADIQLNMVYGRGAMDMKSIGVTHLLAFIDVAKSGHLPRHDLVFLATADEEQGGRYGVQWLFANRPDVFAGIEYALNEGGLNEMAAEKMKYFGIEIGAKLYASLTVEAATEEDLARARLALEPYFPDRRPDKVIPEVRRLFRDVAPSRVQYRELLVDIDDTVARGQFWRLPDSYRAFAQNVITMSGPHSKDGRYTAQVQLVNIPGVDLGPRISWLESFLAPYGARIASVEHRDEAGPLSEADTHLFRLISAQAYQAYRCPAGTLLLARSTNDSRFLRRNGITAYGVLPFPADYFHSLAIHGRDERLRLDWFVQGVALMRSIVGHYASGG